MRCLWRTQALASMRVQWSGRLGCFLLRKGRFEGSDFLDQESDLRSEFRDLFVIFPLRTLYFAS